MLTFKQVNAVALRLFLPLILLSSSISKADTFDTDEAEKTCSAAYPGWLDFIERRKCLSTINEDIRKRIEESRQKRIEKIKEENARECISNDLRRMEDEYIKVYDAVKKEFSSAIDDREGAPITSEQIEAVVKMVNPSISFFKKSALDNIREKVLIGTIASKCNTAFHFLLNIRLDERNNVMWFRAWSETPPTGYLDPVITGRDFLNFRKMKEAAEKLKDELRKQDEKLAQDAAAQKLEQERQKKIENERLSKIAAPGSPGFLKDQTTGCRLWDADPQPQEIVTWDGNCNNGFAEGRGTSRWSYPLNGKQVTQIVTGNFSKGELSDGDFEQINVDGRKTKATRKNGQIDGRLQSWSQTGDLITDINYVNGKAFGNGFITYSNNWRIEGEVKDGKLNGPGKQYRPDGSLAREGDFRNNSLHGFGKEYFSTANERYEGYFIDGKANGKGIYFFSSSSGGSPKQVSIKAKNDCLWNATNYTFFHTLSTDDAKCKIDGFPY